MENNYSITFLKFDVSMTSFLIKGISTKARYLCWKSWIPYLLPLTFMFRVFLLTQPRTFILGFLVEPLLRSLCICRRSPRTFFRPCELLITFPVYLPWVPRAFSRPIVRASIMRILQFISVPHIKFPVQ